MNPFTPSSLATLMVVLLLIGLAAALTYGWREDHGKVADERPDPASLLDVTETKGEAS